MTCEPLKKYELKMLTGVVHMIDVALLQRILTGGTTTAGSRAAVFGALPWESGGTMTPRLRQLRGEAERGEVGNKQCRGCEEHG